MPCRKRQVIRDISLRFKGTAQGLLDELDVIELFDTPGYGKALGEVTEKQKVPTLNRASWRYRYKFRGCRVKRN